MNKDDLKRFLLIEIYGIAMFLFGFGLAIATVK